MCIRDRLDGLLVAKLKEELKANRITTNGKNKPELKKKKKGSFLQSFARVYSTSTKPTTTRMQGNSRLNIGQRQNKWSIISCCCKVLVKLQKTPSVDSMLLTLLTTVVKISEILYLQDSKRTPRKFFNYTTCLLYTSPSPRDATLSRMPSSA